MCLSQRLCKQLKLNQKLLTKQVNFCRCINNPMRCENLQLHKAPVSLIAWQQRALTDIVPRHVGRTSFAQTYANAINRDAFCKHSVASSPLVTLLGSKWFDSTVAEAIISAVTRKRDFCVAGAKAHYLCYNLDKIHVTCICISPSERLAFGSFRN